jgi:hypothetical protein
MKDIRVWFSGFLFGQVSTGGYSITPLASIASLKICAGPILYVT